MGVQSERLEKKLLGTVETSAKALLLEINKELLTLNTGTPVDTGHARASWIPSVGSPNTTPVVGKDNGPNRTGVAQVLAYKLGQGTLYLTNVAPYVKRLNNGWSKQAPALFVEACIIRAMNTIKSKTGVDFGIASMTNGAVHDGGENLASAYSPFGDD